MKISTAQLKDLDILEKISKEQFQFESLRPKFKYLINNKNYIVKVIKSKDKIFGFLVIRYLDKNLIDIYSIAIKDKYQNKGYGYRFLKDVLKNFSGYKITLEVSENNIAKKLYLKFGFKIDAIRKNYYFGTDAVLMSFIRD